MPIDECSVVNTSDIVLDPYQDYSILARCLSAAKWTGNLTFRHVLSAISGGNLDEAEPMGYTTPLVTFIVRQSQSARVGPK